MYKKENQELTEAYNNIPDTEVVNELSWFKPYNRFSTWGKRYVSGRGGFGSGIAAALNPVSDEAWGQSELEDETNQVWEQFRREVLAIDRRPKGSKVLGWFQKTIGISKDAVPMLDEIIPNQRYYDDDVLRGLFKEILRQAQQFKMSGKMDATSVYATDPKSLIKLILEMDVDQTYQLVKYIYTRVSEELINVHGIEIGRVDAAIENLAATMIQVNKMGEGYEQMLKDFKQETKEEDVVSVPEPEFCNKEEGRRELPVDEDVKKNLCSALNIPELVAQLGTVGSNGDVPAEESTSMLEGKMLSGKRWFGVQKNKA